MDVHRIQPFLPYVWVLRFVLVVLVRVLVVFVRFD